MLMDTNYSHLSHSHCWNQNGNPACGIPLGKHAQCCLCDLTVPKPTTLSEHMSRASKARHAKRTPEERSAYAKMMVEAREAKRRKTT